MTCPVLREADDDTPPTLSPVEVDVRRLRQESEQRYDDLSEKRAAYPSGAQAAAEYDMRRLRQESEQRYDDLSERITALEDKLESIPQFVAAVVGPLLKRHAVALVAAALAGLLGLGGAGYAKLEADKHDAAQLQRAVQRAIIDALESTGVEQPSQGGTSQRRR